MQFKHIIGLDIGTNSLGWCLIKEYEDNHIEIIKSGVHIFPIGTIVDDKNNKEKTKNEQRRSFRGASRNRYRFKLRRKNLKFILDKLNMLPDYSKYYKEKSKVQAIGQSYELYKLRANSIDSKNKIDLKEIGRIFMLLNKYRGFKSNAKKLQKRDNESGDVEKGYKNLQNLIDKSNSQTIGEYFFKMHEKAKEWYDNNKWHNSNEPIDERAYNDNGDFILFNSNGIRRHHGRYTLRDMYYTEFDMIWAAQKIHYPDIFTGSKQEYEEIMKKPYKDRIEGLKTFKKTNYWHIRDYCIYYQRPLKSQKKYVSNCQFERGSYKIKMYNVFETDVEKQKEKRIWTKKARKASHKSNPLFQEFRIWQKLHQISYSSTIEDIYKKPLKLEWLSDIAGFLMIHYEIYLNETKKARTENKYWIGKLLHEKGHIQNSQDYNFYIDKSDEDVVGEDKNENKIAGNITYASFFESLGENTYNKFKSESTKRNIEIKKGYFVEVEESKLMLLWNTIYQAKDGLLKGDDWLKSILTEISKWNLTPEQADNLISKGLIDDYASYSSKVLKAVLPFMRKGLNEFEALKATNMGYINEDETIGVKLQIKDKISQLAYQELRNPVVERSLSKAIKLVNSLLERYKSEINRDNLEIRIESTRQFRKPRQERENERSKNSEKDKLREQYATYLTKNKEKLGFKKDIYKFDSLVNKYELWLQMNMNEDDEIFIKEFKSFSNITKENDRLKHQLWLECGRMCPYTGKIINFIDCFSSEVEIEHIIPLSRSLDDSFNNKTLTYRNINAEKGNLTPLEYLTKKGSQELRNFKTLLKAKTHAFSESKIQQFLAENVSSDFSSNQITNTSYIAKYTRDKMKEVCEKVYFTNGFATAELRNKDWNLSNLLDKIRYEEDYSINIDDCYKEYYSIKKMFLTWYKNKHNTTDFKIDWKKLPEDENIKLFISETNNDLLYWDAEILKFEEFRNKSGKKDRSDHRHHAVDAFVTACCSPKIIKELSTHNALKEEKHLEFREKISRYFEYIKLKESISSILVSHSEKQTLIKKRINRIKTKDGIKERITYAPQGKLHEESFYSKRNNATVRRVELFNDQSSDKKTLYEQAADLDYKVKNVVKWHYIEDNQLYLITKNRLEQYGKIAFFKEQMENNPFYRISPTTPQSVYSKKNKKPLPIVKSVRKRFNIDRTLINIPAKNEKKEIVIKNRYSNNESNYIMAFYKCENKVFARPVSFFTAVENKMNKKQLLPDEIIYKNSVFGINSDMPWIKNGDILYILTENENKEKINWKDMEFLKGKLFKVKGISSLITPNPKYGNYEYGNTSLLKINAVKTDSYPSQSKINDALKLKAFTLSHDKLNAIKVRLNILGEITVKGDDCF